MYADELRGVRGFQRQPIGGFHALIYRQRVVIRLQRVKAETHTAGGRVVADAGDGNDAASGTIQQVILRIEHRLRAPGTRGVHVLVENHRNVAEWQRHDHAIRRCHPHHVWRCHR